MSKTDLSVDVMDKDKALPFPGKDTFWCSKMEKLNIVAPKTWLIESEHSEFKWLQLFTIHLLPQSATRVHSGKNKDGIWAVQKDSPTGSPTCVGKIFITFVSSSH